MFNKQNSSSAKNNLHIVKGKANKDQLLYHRSKKNLSKP